MKSTVFQKIWASLDSLIQTIRRAWSPIWGRIIRRPVPCSRCKADMRKVGVGRTRDGRTVLQGDNLWLSVSGEVPAHAYCPTCAALATNLDAQVSDLQALIDAGGIPHESYTDASGTMAKIYDGWNLDLPASEIKKT